MNYIYSACHDRVYAPVLADLGSGSGRLARYLVEHKRWRASTVFLVDRNEQALAQRNPAFEPYRTDIAGTGMTHFEDDSIDCIVSNAFFWTIGRHRAASVVREINRVMKPGGMLLAVNGFHTPASATRNNIAEHLTWRPEQIRTLFLSEKWDKCNGLVALSGPIWHVVSGNHHRVADFRCLKKSMRKLV